MGADREKSYVQRPQVEVRVRRKGKPVSHHTIDEFPAIIGRDEKADVRLDSRHVSRCHARLELHGEDIFLVDTGSTNGFSVGGRRRKRVSVAANRAVAICDFQLLFGVRRPRQANADVPSDWLDEDGTSRDPDTAVFRARSQSARKGTGSDFSFRSFTSGATSLPSELDSPSSLSVGELAGGDLTDEELEELLPPDAPPLLSEMHREANSLLYGEGHAQVAVEVIQTVGGRIYNVELLKHGESCWWGGEPKGLEHLWLVPTASRFPIVTHDQRGEYQVQVPRSPHWKMLHRGTKAVDPYRSGPLIGCRAEHDDQLEVSFGPFATYTRCVRLPKRTGWSLRKAWPGLDRILIAAVVISAALHSMAMAVPLDEVPRIRRPLYTDRFVELGPGYIAPPSNAKEPSAQGEEEQAAQNETKEEPELEKQPERARHEEISSRRPPPRRRLNHRRNRRTERRAPPPAEEQQPEADPSPPRPAGVSVEDFRVAGLMQHLPSVEVPDSERGSALRGGARLLRDGSSPGTGIVNKRPGGMSLKPGGRLPKTAIMRVVNQHARDIERCYNKSLAREPGIAGQIELQWVVDAVGTVQQVRVIYDEVGSPSLQDCLKKTIRTWVFPPPKGGPARLSFPFAFSSLR